MILTKRILSVVALATIPLALTSCLGVDSNGVTPATVETTTFAPSLGVDLAASTRTTNGAYVRDITVGTGAAVVSGQQLNVRYTVWLSTGTLIETNVNATSPFQFRLGAREVILGWDEGIPGMRVGGKRQLVLPPSLGYGPNNNGQIPGNSVLVFTVEII